MITRRKIAQLEIIGASKLYVAVSDDAPPEIRSQVHRHSFYEIAWLRRGNGQFVCDFQRYQLPQGTLVFVAPGQVHTWYGDDYSLVLIGFKPELLSHNWIHPTVLFQLPYFSRQTQPFLTVDSQQAGVFDYLFGTLLNRYKDLGQSAGRYIDLSEAHEHILLAYLHLILIEAEQLYEQTHDTDDTTLSSAHNITVQFQNLIETSFTERLQIQDYADRLSITPNYLTEVIRQTLGDTPRHVVQQRLLIEAQRLLSFTEDSIAQISEQLSFKNPSQFGQWFKNLQGISPGQFRKQRTDP